MTLALGVKAPIDDSAFFVLARMRLYVVEPLQAAAEIER